MRNASAAHKVRRDVVSRAETSTVPVAALAVGERRFEAEGYLTPGYMVRQAIERSGLAWTAMSGVAQVWQPPRLKGVTVGASDGIPFLTASQVFDSRPTPRKWVAPKHTPHLEARYVQKGQILVTCSGSVGQAIRVYSAHLGMVVSHDILRVQPLAAADEGWLYCFLRTKACRAMMRSSHYGNVVKHLEPLHVQAIPVLPLEQKLRDRLGQDMDRVFELREEAYQLTAEAEALFAEASSVGELAAAEPTFGIGSAVTCVGRRRLDAYHHNTLARALESRLAAPGRQLCRLGDVAQVFGVKRFKHVYADAGIAYIDSEDLFKVWPETDKFIPPKAKKDATDYFVSPGWVLMACSGQIYGQNGGVVVATDWHANKVLSNHVLRIVPNGIGAGYLSVALGHPSLGQPLVLRWAFGTQIPELDPDDVAEVPVVRLGGVEERIDGLALRAAAMRAEASSIEERAVAEFDTWIAEMVGVA